MKHLLRMYFFLCLLCSSQLGSGQETQDTTDQGVRLYIFEFSADLVNPISTFGDRLDNLGLGASVLALKQRAVDNPGFLGLQTAYHFYETQAVDYVDIFNNINVNVRDRVSTHDISLSTVYRHYPDLVFGPLEFYVQANLGLRWFYTTLRSTDTDVDESLDFRFLQNAWLINGGAGIGFNLDIQQSVLLNFSMHYETGSTGTYYAKEEGLSGIDAIDFFRRNTSSLDQVVYKIGVTWLY